MSCRMELPVVRFEGDLASLFCTLSDLPDLIGICCNRLLDQDVLACSHSFDRPLAVQAIWEWNVHGVDVSLRKQLVIRAICSWDLVFFSIILSLCEASCGNSNNTGC